MRCRRCNYSLWNIRDRVCPECGEPFLPSEQEFVVNSVKFMCPHCSQDYYGQGDKGHLEPSAFTCVSCSRHVSMDEMILLPADGMDESVTEVDVMPWRERARIGRVKAWFKTVYRALFMPIVLMRNDPGPSVGDAWLFMLITLLLYAIPGGLIFLPFLLMGGGPMTFPMVPSLFIIGLLVVLPCIMALLWGLIAHGLLSLTGPTRHGLGGTFQAVCYASAANIFLAVPCFNMQIFWMGWIWWAVSATLMVMERQQVKGWRASLATLTPVVLVGALMIAGILGLMFFVLRTTTQMNTALQISELSVQQVGTALLEREEASGAFPTHALEMIADGTLQGYQVVLTPLTQQMNVPIGLETLQSWELLSTEEQAQLLQDEIAAQPADVIAHRFGDLVFTYHGIDPEADDGGLWIVVGSPDPVVQRWGMMGQGFVVMTLDGATATLDPVEFINELDVQNLLRKEHGLEPLPNPDQVTHGAPVVPGP